MGGGVVNQHKLEAIPTSLFTVFFRNFFMIVLHPVLLQVSKMWNNEIGAQYTRKQNKNR